MKIDQEKREKYNPNDIFKNRNSTERIQQINVNETALVEYKENFFTKFKNFIFKILNIKN